MIIFKTRNVINQKISCFQPLIGPVAQCYRATIGCWKVGLYKGKAAFCSNPNKLWMFRNPKVCYVLLIKVICYNKFALMKCDN